MLIFPEVKPVMRLALIMVFSISVWASQPEILKVSLNGLDIGIDRDTGSLLLLSSPATGTILEAPPEKAGLVDLAYPVDSFIPMRLASRFSRADVAQKGDTVVITWETLGPSRSNLPLPTGKVYVQATIRPADDGRSVIMACRIENKSAVPVPQILFPDLWGLKPFGGTDGTHLRLAREVEQPFLQRFKQPDSASSYAEGNGWNSYRSFENALRWIDFGSLEGGLSIFQKKWGSEDKPRLVTHRGENDPLSLRLAWEHRETVAPGKTWESGEFWFTPHPGGWAKGIEVYRHYVDQVNPVRPLPAHVRDGLGFQTIFMMEELERDPAKAYFRFSDLPRVAQDATQYGINEVVFWFSNPPFVLPIPLFPALGTREELVENIRKSKELGVNMAPFISVHMIQNSGAKRLFGVEPGPDTTQNWMYHSELIPNIRPYYLTGGDETWIPSANMLWQKNVQENLTDWINAGIFSISFDQFGGDQGYGGNRTDIRKTEFGMIEKVRSLARAKDPESTFSGESLDAISLERDGRVLDYTWNWVDYLDEAPVLNVLRAPRQNCNVEDSPSVVKKAFSDGLYLNVMPRRPDAANGSALISSQPEMAKALQETASLRKQFLPFFVEGVSIGDSVLSRQTSAFVRGYTLNRKLLVIALNDTDQAKPVMISSDLSLWLPATQSYFSNYYNSSGKLIRRAHAASGKWSGTTDLLQPNELALFEIEAE